MILLLGLALRLWGLADHNIWWDEGLAAWAARLSPARIVEWTARDVHPPLYFLLVHCWWLLLGDGEWALRFPSALIGVLGIALAAGFGQAVGGRRASILAALFVALSRFMVTWSQEMRMYIWAAALATAALWAAFQLWRRGGWRPWLAYVAATGAGLWTLYLSVSIPIIANLAFPLVWWRRGRPRSLLLRWATAQVAVLALFVPWLLYSLPRMATWSTAEPFTPAFFVRLYATMLAVGAPVDLERYTGLAVAVLALWVLAVAALWRAHHSSEQTAAIVMLVLGVGLPGLAVYAVALPGHLFYAPRLAPRYLLPLAVCFYMLLAWGTAALARRARVLAAGSATFVAIAALIGLGTFYPGRARTDDYLSLTAALDAYRREGDTVLLHTDQDWPLFAAHWSGPWRGIPAGLQVEASGAMDLLEQVWPRAEAVWLVTTPDAQRADPEGAIQRWLADHAVAVARWPFGEVTLTAYARTPSRAATLEDLVPGYEPPGTIDGSPAGPLRGAWFPLHRYLAGDTLHLALFWDQAPPAPARVTLDGPARREVILPAPRLASQGPTRQQVDLPLTPDLPPGHYRLSVRWGDAPTESIRPQGTGGSGPEVAVGQFDILPRVVGEALSDAAISHPLGLKLGDSITLLGYDLPRVTTRSGETVDLVLYWRAEAPVAARYKVFTHLVGQVYNAGSDNFLWGQQDNEPMRDQVPTTVWPPGVVIADPYRIAVDPNAPPGVYKLEVGMYGLLDGARLPVAAQAGSSLGDAVALTPIEITVR